MNMHFFAVGLTLKDRTAVKVNIAMLYSEWNSVKVERFDVEETSTEYRELANLIRTFLHLMPQNVLTEFFKKVDARTTRFPVEEFIDMYIQNLNESREAKYTFCMEELEGLVVRSIAERLPLLEEIITRAQKLEKEISETFPEVSQARVDVSIRIDEFEWENLKKKIITCLFRELEIHFPEIADGIVTGML